MVLRLKNMVLPAFTLENMVLCLKNMVFNRKGLAKKPGTLQTHAHTCPRTRGQNKREMRYFLEETRRNSSEIQARFKRKCTRIKRESSVIQARTVQKPSGCSCFYGEKQGCNREIQAQFKRESSVTQARFKRIQALNQA
jgi:hypothetical protein